MASAWLTALVARLSAAFWARTAVRSGSPARIHPTRSPAWSDYPVEARSKYGIWWSLGWPYETSVCMARLVYSGVFDTYPGLRVITHHAGAMVPHFAGRTTTSAATAAA